MDSQSPENSNPKDKINFDREAFLFSQPILKQIKDGSPLMGVNSALYDQFYEKITTRLDYFRPARKWHEEDDYKNFDFCAFISPIKKDGHHEQIIVNKNNNLDVYRVDWNILSRQPNGTYEYIKVGLQKSSDESPHISLLKNFYSGDQIKAEEVSQFEEGIAMDFSGFRRDAIRTLIYQDDKAAIGNPGAFTDMKVTDIIEKYFPIPE